MVLDPRKRQKKTEKRKAKQREKHRALARRKPDNIAVRLQRAVGSPFLHCVANEELWREGMANVLVSRELPDGKVAFVIFLVDAYCLGVKNVAMDVVVRTRYENEVRGRMFEHRPHRVLSPACARKLVEGAVEYTRSLGFPPYADYETAKVIFGDVDASQCTQEFTFGKDGKPLFVAGPYDSQERCRRIIATLEESCGPGGYNFVLPVLTPGAFRALEALDDSGEEYLDYDDEVDA